MKIGVIGSGNVGGTLGTRWARNGHTVTFGSRDPQSKKMRDLVTSAGPNARSASSDEAVQSSDVLLLSTPWEATRGIVQGLGDLRGKILIDAVNPLLPQLAGLAVGTNTSCGEQVAQWAPGARVVKAFNTIGNNIMANPDFGGERPVLFYCGDDAPAKDSVKQLAAELGFDPHDAGPLTQARVLEPFAMLWISLAVAQGYGREFAFKLMRRSQQL
jgi:8-hydroxy-5-deazaflavin:NADPH oxidoreductase